MLKLDGKTLSYDVVFTHNDINYPANWLRLASLEEKNAMGITEVADPPWYDQRFYWGVGNPKALEDTNNYASYDKDGKGEGEVTGVTTGLKTLWISKQKDTAGKLLAATDWMVTRKAETDVAIPSDTTTYRAAVRTVCGEREAQITNCADTDALCALITASATIKNDKDEDVTNPAAIKAWPTE